MIKTKLKAYLSVLLLLTVTVACSFLLTGCGGGEVEQIYVDNSYAPRLTYVVGQELDLSKGVVTVIIGGEESLIPMTDEGVTVTGYDMNTVGSQTLTVTYQEKTTTITVNVIPRLTAEGFENSYFTGDSFNAEKGKVKVAKDDATTSMVPLDDPRVTIENFDSTTAGDKTVTAKYSDGTNTYTCTFTVTVYDAATSTISIVYPQKTNYGSHETELDFTGGYITIKGGPKGKLEKHVDITKDMTSGYDPSVVTASRPSAVQTITISYLGKTFTYSVKIKHSNVSMINDSLAIIKDIDLSAEELTLTPEQKEASWIAIREYYDLKDSEKDIFSEDDVNIIVKLAAIGVSELYREELENYKDTILYNGNLQLICKTYDQTVTDFAKLKDSTELLNRYAVILRTVLKDYPELTVSGDKLVKDTVFVMPEGLEKELIGILDHLINMHKHMEIIPDNWTVDILNAMDKDSNQNNWAEPRMYRLRVDISTAPYYKNGQGNIYNILNNWREKGDFFDIIYSYFLYSDYYTKYGKTEQEKIEEIVSMLDLVPWPKKINTWYGLWYSAMGYSTSIKNAMNGTKEDLQKIFMTDLTPYNYYINSMQKMATEIKQNKDSDKLTYDLYLLIAGDTRISKARYETYGQLKLNGFLSDETEFGEMWKVYLELADLYATGKLINAEGKVITEGYEDKFEAVMNKLGSLSPVVLHEFLGSVNFYYGKTDSEILALTPYTREVDGKTVSTYLSTLATLINAYYLNVFDDSEFEVFEKLLIAMESYARLNKVSSAADTFKKNMSEAITAYGKIADKTLFNTKMGDCYDAYVALYNAYISETDVVISAEAKELIDSLIAMGVKFETIRDYLVTEGAKDENERQIRNEAYIVLFSLYENIRYSYLYLSDLAEEDGNLRLALYRNLYEYDGSGLTVEQIFGKIGNQFWSYMVAMPDITIKNGDKSYSYKFYDVYIGSDLVNFLFYSADMLYAQFNGSAVDGFSETDFNNMIKAYNKLDSVVILVLEAFKTNDLYFSLIDSYVSSAVTDESTLALADKLIEVGKSYVKYQITATEENKNSFKALVASAQNLKELLTLEDDYNKYLKAIYEHYEAKANGTTEP